MALVSEQDAALRELAQSGKAGAFTAEIPDQKLRAVMDDIYRRLQAQARVIRLLLQHTRQGPEWGGGESRVFHVKHDAVDATTRQQAFVHGLGYTPDRFMVVLASSDQVGGSVITWGGLVLVAGGTGKNSVTFEMDADAKAAKMNYAVIVWREAMVPPQPELLPDQALPLETLAPPGHVDIRNING